MKISENWLRELVALKADRAALIEKLNMIGHEVEEAVPLGENLAGVVVAQIIECAKHPEADRLQVCKVDIGNGGTLQIVCGAPNARPGLKAPLATIGTQVGEITIKAAKLRGVESSGMLCSAKELGIDADASGLLELPADAPVGKPLAEYLGLPDCTIDLGLTPNRADCLSLHGVANDVAAAFGVAHKLPALAPIDAATTRTIEIKLESPADCPRYCGRFIDGIDPNARAPLWLTERLRRCGLRSISLLVDVTNYVMIELGQPLHAFDASTLCGPLGVRRARAGEKLKLLDDRDVALTPELLVITDADQPVALAGLMGGYSTRVTDTTHDVFLEAAHFAPGALAGRARNLGMHTDAAHRFERGVDPELPRRALERATQLIVEFGGGKPGAIVEAVSPAHLPKRESIALRRSRISRVLGIDVPDAEVERILAALNLKVEKTADGWRATPPSARFDLALEVDLIEEVARIHGYERIPTHAPRGELDVPVLAEDRVDVASLRAQLAARDYFEAITYAFVHGDALRTWQLDAGAIALDNPLSADLGVMRTSLLPGLVAALMTNRNRQQERVRLFEVGNVFHKNAEPGAAPIETLRIAGVACGRAAELQWGVDKRAVDFHDMKGDYESLIALTAAAGEFACEPANVAWLHPGRSAQVKRGGVVAGHMGALHPSLAKALDLDTDVYVFEFDIAPLAARAVPRSRPIARFPSVRRDLSFELPENVNYVTVEMAVKAAVGPVLREIFVFDRYAGHSLGAGIKSLAIGLILQDDYRTLTDGDADASVALAVAALEQHCQARLRG
jgi:phenylalanyl-tRNA synthetase beta chain